MRTATKDRLKVRRQFIPLVVGPVLLLAGACDQAERQAREDTPPAFQAISSAQPATPVITATAPPRREVAAVRGDTGPQQTSSEKVRLTRDGLLLDRPVRFDADLLAFGPDSVVLSDGYILTLRLPEGHTVSLEVGGRYVVDFRPTSVAGSDEISTTVYEAADQEAQAGPVVMQAVERGGHALIRIVEETFVVEQIDDGDVILDSDTEITSQPNVRLTAGRGRWVLAPSEPLEFQAAGALYRVSLLRSLHFRPKPGPQSEEGPTYVLEYVITRLAR